MKKLTISIIVMTLIIILSTATVMAVKNNDVIAFIGEENITVTELQILKNEYTYLPNINSIPSDNELIQNIAKIKVKNKLCMDYNISLDNSRKKEIESEIDQILLSINRSLNSTVDIEKESANETIEYLVQVANADNMTLDEYINKVMKSTYENFYKEKLLIQNCYSSKDELDTYLNNFIKENLIIVE